MGASPHGAIALTRRPISDLTVIRLNEPVVEDEEDVAPWPPPGGLEKDEDPFAGAPAVAEPHFLLGDERSGRSKWEINRERAVYISLIAHLLFVLLLVTVKLPHKKELPLSEQPDPLGIIALMKTPEREPPVPIQFFPAPGPKAPAPGKEPLPSDANRVAHGGDPDLPKMTQPMARPQPGIQELEAGKRGAPQPSQAPPAQQPQASMASGAMPRGERSRDGAPGEESDAPSESPLLRGLRSSALANITAEQAARAAQSGHGQGGEEGGGFEREGGFVDSGPLSFDTVGYDWGAYAAEMIRKIKRNWDVPALAHYGLKGWLTIRFFILKDGTVDAEHILVSSSRPPYDNAAFQAIARSSRFRPLPSDLGHDREGVTVSFFYNMRPEDVDPATAAGRRPAR